MFVVFFVNGFASKSSLFFFFYWTKWYLFYGYRFTVQYIQFSSIRICIAHIHESLLLLFDDEHFIFFGFVFLFGCHWTKLHFKSQFGRGFFFAENKSSNALYFYFRNIRCMWLTITIFLNLSLFIFFNKRKLRFFLLLQNQRKKPTNIQSNKLIIE